MSEALAVIDLGGSRIKVHVSRPDTGDFFSVSVPTMAERSGDRVTANPDFLFRKLLQALNAAASHLDSGVHFSQVTVATIRQGFLLIGDTEELTPMIFNSDTSGEGGRESLEKYGLDELYVRTGHWYAPQLTLPKLIGIKKHQPGIWRESKHLLFAHDWIMWRLTGRIVTEMTLVSAGQLANISESRVDYELLDELGLRPELISEPKDVGEPMGKFSAENLLALHPAWKDTSAHVGGGDTHFFTRGVLIANESEAICVVVGSSTPIQLISEHATKSTNKCKPWISTSFIRDRWVSEVNAGYPGSFAEWLSQMTATKLRDFETLDHQELRFDEKLHFISACRRWTPDGWNHRPSPTISGVDLTTSSADLVKANLLDHSLAIAMLIHDLDETNSVPIRITGGGATRTTAGLVATILGRAVGTLSTPQAMSNAMAALLHHEFTQSVPVDVEPMTDELAADLYTYAQEHRRIYEELAEARV